MRILTAVGFLFILTAGLTGCATTTGPVPGQRVLDAVVVAREFEPARGVRVDPWGAAHGSEGTGSWYLVFEAHDGDATARYRLPVTQQEYMLFQEGTDAQITLVGYDLRSLRKQPQ